MNKKGTTLIEVVVAMGIFAILATIIVGAFVLILNMKALTSTMKEAQQKLRMAIELTSRLSRQAKRVSVSGAQIGAQPGAGNILDLYFDSDTATRFSVTQDGDGRNKLYSEECGTFNNATGDCIQWGINKNDLLGGELDLNDRPTNIPGDTITNYVFVVTVGDGNTPALEIKLDGTINNIRQYYDNQFNIDNYVILESLPWAWD